MKKIGKFHIFFILGIALWVLSFPAYLHFYSLGETDIFSPNQIWENPDSEVLLASLEKKGKILGGVGASVPFTLFFSVIFCGIFSRFSLQTLALDKQARVLRC